MPAISPLLKTFGPSAINEVFALATRLRREGADIVDLSLGEPDFATPPHVRAAAVAAIEGGSGKYTASDGSADLKDAIRIAARRDGLPDPIDLIVGAGVKPLLFQAVQTLVAPGERVGIPVPGWASYDGMVRLAGAIPVPIRCSLKDGFRMTPAALSAALSGGVRAVILNSPSNPTGAILSATDIVDLAVVLRDHPATWILSDDIYRLIRHDGRAFATMASVAPDFADRTLTFDGVSKGYAMTGWRIGWVSGPGPAMAAMRDVVSQSVGSPPEPSQHAAIAALTGPQVGVAERAATYTRRRDAAMARLSKIPGLDATPPDGAFYLWVGCTGLLGGVLRDSTDLSRHLLSRYGLATVPGDGFGVDGYLRLSFATSDAELARGFDRLAAAASDIRARPAR